MEKKPSKFVPFAKLTQFPFFPQEAEFVTATQTIPRDNSPCNKTSQPWCSL